MAHGHGHKRRTIGRRIVLVLQWVLLAIAGLVVAALLSLQLRLVRNLISRQVESVLQSTFAGRVAIERLDAVSLTGLDGARVRIDDPGGTQVLLVDGAAVRIDTFATLRSLLKKQGDLVIDITAVKLGYVDANLDADDHGNLKLLQAFEPKEKKPEPTPSARATVVHLRKIALDHGWVHGQPKGAPHVDADLDRLDLSLIVGGERTVADLATLELYARALPQGLDLRTHLEAHYAKPAPNGGDQAGRADLKGELSGVPFTFGGSIDGPEVAANLDVPKVTPDAARKLSPDLALTNDVTAHAEARGHLPDIDAKAHVDIGKGTIDLEARASIAEAKKVHATLDAKGIDLRALARTAPRSNLGVAATIDFAMDAKGDGNGTYAIEVPTGNVGGNLVPAARLAGEIATARTAEGATMLRANGNGRIDEPGAPTALRFDLQQSGPETSVGFRLNTVAGKLDRTRIGNAVSGSVTLDAEGTVCMGRTTTVDGTVDVRASQIVNGGTRVDRAALRAKLQGDLADPTASTVDIDLDGRDLTAGGMRFANAKATLRGALQAAQATVSLVPTDGPHLEADGWISLDQELAVRNARVTATQSDVKAVLSVTKASLGGSKVRIEGVALEGVGEPLHAEVVKTERATEVRAKSSGLDLGKVGRLLRSRELGGKLALDVDMALRPTAANGHVLVNLTEGQMGRVKDGTAQIDAKFTSRRIEASVHGKFGELGWLDIDGGRVEFEGNAPLGLAALDKAKGRLDLDAQLDLSRIRAVLPRGSLPFTDMQGVLRVKGNVARDSTDQTPDLQVSAETKGLYLSGRGNQGREELHDTRIYPTPPWSLEGVDFRGATKVDKDSGDTAFKGSLLDRNGTIVSIDVDSKAIPYRQWLKGKSIDAASLRDLRWSAEIAVPRRELKKLPAILKTKQMGGSVGASFHFDGSLAKPDLHLTVEANEWVTPVTRDMQPLNAKIDARYQPGQGTIDLKMGTREKQLFDGTVEMRGALPGLPVSPGEAPAPFTAGARMRLADFPLETVGLFSDLQVKGLLSGEVTIDDVHEDARAKVALTLRDLQLGRARFPRGRANVDFDGRALRANVRLDQRDGFLEAQAQAGMRWGANTAPAVVKEEPAFAVLKANRFRAAALLPFAGEVLGELDGRIDANARVDLVPNGPPKMQGSVTFDRGRFQLARVGEPMHGATARVTFAPDGVIRLEDFVAQGSSGRINAKGVARLNGFQLVGARANIRIPKSDPFPLDIDGQPIGEINADISIAADMTPDQRAMNVKIDIPRLHLELPLASSNKPQELSEAEKVRVGYFRRPKQFVILPKDAEDLKGREPPPPGAEARQTNIAIHLGNNVEVERGTMLRVALTGDPKFEVAEEPKMTGQIQLTRGTLQVQGKRFRVERGTVTFVGAPDNPQVVVSAYWDAPDGTRIYADFVGPLKTGNVKLRSEPARPQNEILAIILFGTAEGSSSTPYPTQQPNGTVQAGVTVGGFATEGLSKGIDELTGLDVSAKIDTSSSANPKPEVEVQIARDISVQIAYVIGTPPPGVNPDKTFFSFDWRFRRNWSMETTFGDQGSSIVDFLWQYRY